MFSAEFVQFETEDGLLLPGLFFEAKKSKKVVITLHGNGSSSVFYNHGYDLAQELNRKGISLLMFNNRGAHIIKRFTVRAGDEEIRISQGTAYERIADCMKDIDAAVAFLKGRSYATFHLAGHSTGANKICVYDHYKPDNIFRSYVMTAGGDDTGIYFDTVGEEMCRNILATAREKASRGEDEEIVREILPDIMSYRAFLDIVDPDGDYNCFPFSEVLKQKKLSTKPLFRYFGGIRKPSLVVYGENDEFAWGDARKCVDILKGHRPEFTYMIIPGADHGFHGKREVLAERIADFITSQ